MTIFYIAATDRISWGRGTRDWEAIAHAISHGGINVSKVFVFELSCPEGTTENDVSVNEMGSITAPAGTEVKEQGPFDASRMTSKFFSYKDEIDAVLYDGGDNED